MNPQPSTSLVEEAANKIESEFPSTDTTTARVIWWDDGGHLREVIQSATEELGIRFRGADKFPLELRVGAVAEEREADRPHVWYVPEAKDGRDWFRDIKETGGEIVCSIEQLTADIYEVNAWDIFDVERHDAEARQDAASIIKTRFTHSIPLYDDLKEEIITRGGGQLLDHLLRDGWPEISRDSGTVAEVRERLQDNHNIPIPSGTDPDEITETVRRWAVAQALVDNGIDPDRFEMSVSETGHSPLIELLEIRGDKASASRYLGASFWPDVIDRLDDVWDYASCPVDGALDTALWDEWYEMFDSGDLKECIERAERRQEALDLYPNDAAWISLWAQSEHLARLKHYFRDWDERDTSIDPFEQYADTESGSWRIDNEVLQLQLLGNPEEDIQPTHPAKDSLLELRETLLTNRYREYLDTLAEDVKASMQVGAPLVGKQPAYEWWSDHEDDFDELGTVAIFLIDALRFDLAQRLAERLGETFEVKRENRLSTLPSETKFGMAALTPGRSFRFALSMANGSLTVSQGDRSLSNKPQRVSFYEDEGWEVPDNPESGWEHHHIAYYEKELDDVGEGEIGNIERHFHDYIDDLSETISQKLDEESWDRIYVVTDHGFVLLPDGTTMESISVDAPNAETKYRRIAGDEFDDAGVGLHLTPDTAGLDYLNTTLQILVNPTHYFSKRGYTGNRYYHGGILPQECMLSFLEIQS